MQNDSSVVPLFFLRTITIFSQWRMTTLCLAYNIFMNFLTLWRNSSYGHPPTPQKFPPISTPSPSEFPLTIHVGGGGGMDIFWNHTFSVGLCYSYIAVLLCRLSNNLHENGISFKFHYTCKAWFQLGHKKEHKHKCCFLISK